MDKWTHERVSERRTMPACTIRTVPCLAVPWWIFLDLRFLTSKVGRLRTATIYTLLPPWRAEALSSTYICDPIWFSQQNSRTSRGVMTPALESQEHWNTEVQRSWVTCSNTAKKMPSWSLSLTLSTWLHCLFTFRKSAPNISHKETRGNLSVSSLALRMRIKSIPWEFIMTCQ